MHDTTDGSHWHEPEGLKNAGYGAWKRPNTPYDDYMEAQGIPIYRGIGVRRVQDMPLKRWNRMGGNGTFIQLYGTEGRWGCYVVEVPGAGALNPERHMYEEIMVVGRTARDQVDVHPSRDAMKGACLIEDRAARPRPSTRGNP